MESRRLSEADVCTKSGYVYGCYLKLVRSCDFHKIFFGPCIVTPLVWLTCNRRTSRTQKRAQQERPQDLRFSGVEGWSFQGCYTALTHNLPAFWMSSEEKEMGGACSARGGERKWEAYTGFWWGNLKERDRLGDLGLDGRTVLRRIFKKWGVGVWTGSSWLRMGTSGGHLWLR